MTDKEKLLRVEHHLIEIDRFLDNRTHWYIIAGLLIAYLAAATGILTGLI